jgi:hypothetical protein
MIKAKKKYNEIEDNSYYKVKMDKYLKSEDFSRKMKELKELIKISEAKRIEKEKLEKLGSTLKLF